MQITINGKPRIFDQATLNLAQLVIALKLEGKRLAIECNSEIVPRSQFDQCQLNDGDKLEIVGAVGGG
ncbi:MAG: sulfur carrier protein ThiS [Methylophilaceae bacterium]